MLVGGEREAKLSGLRAGDPDLVVARSLRRVGRLVVEWSGTVVLTTPRLLLGTFRRDDGAFLGMCGLHTSSRVPRMSRWPRSRTWGWSSRSWSMRSRLSNGAAAPQLVGAVFAESRRRSRRQPDGRRPNRSPGERGAATLREPHRCRPTPRGAVAAPRSMSRPGFGAALEEVPVPDGSMPVGDVVIPA